MTNFEKAGAKLKLSIVEGRLYTFFLEYSFYDRHNDKDMCNALLTKHTKQIAESLNFAVPDDYGVIDTDTEYGTQSLASLASTSSKEGEVL